MIDIYDFIGFAKSQGLDLSYKARIGEFLVLSARKSPTGRKISTRYDDTIHKITWYIEDYDILRSDLDSLVQKYLDGLQSLRN